MVNFFFFSFKILTLKSVILHLNTRIVIIFKVSLDAGQTCFALLQLSKRLLGCRCRCHKTSGNDNVEQTTLNTKDVSNEQV